MKIFLDRTRFLVPKFLIKYTLPKSIALLFICFIILFQALHQRTTPQVEGTIQTTQIISVHILDYGMIIFGKGVSMIFIIRVYRITELKKMTKGDFEIPALFCLPQLGKQSLNFVTHKFPHHSKGGNLKIPFTYILFFTLFLYIPYTA